MEHNRGQALYADFRQAHDMSWRQMDRFYHEADRDLRFYLNDQMDSQEEEYLKRQRRNALVFNKIKRVVNLVSGYQRAHRKAFRVEPRSAGDAQAVQAAHQLGKGLHTHMMAQSGYELLSKVFEQGPVKSGFGLVNLWNDFSTDPINGNLTISYVPWTSCFIDPQFTQLDLRDCSYMGRRAWVSKEEAKAIVPWAKNDIENLPKGGRRDMLFPYIKRIWNMTDQDLHALDEYWRLDHREVRIVIDTRNGRWREWPEEAGDERLSALLESQPALKVKEHIKRSVKVTYFLDGEMVYDGLDPLGIDDYNFVPFVGFFDYEHHDWQNKLQGVIRPLRDPQVESNRRRSKMLDILDSQISSGYIVEEDAPVDPEAPYQTGQGKVIWARSGKGDRIWPQRAGDVPQGLFRMAATMDNDIMEIGGINPDMLGQSAEGEERSNSTLSATRRQQGLMTLQELFDNYYESKTILGKKMLRAMQENWTRFKVSQVIQEEPVPAFFASRELDNTVSVEDAPMTTTQKSLEFMQKFELKQAGAPIPWKSVLINAPLEGKEELLQQVEQAEQMQSQQAEIQQKLEAAKLQEDIAGAQEDRSQAKLNQAKTAAEVLETQVKADQTQAQIEGAEKDRMLRLLEVATQLEQAEQEKVINQATRRK